VVMLVARCTPWKHRDSVTLVDKAGVPAVLCGEVTPPPPATARVGRCDGGHLRGSLLTCHHGLSHAHRGTSVSEQNT